MSRLKELINKLCPDGVEYVELGEVVNVIRGKRLTKNQLSEEKTHAYSVPVIHGGDTPMGYYIEANRKAGTTIVINTGTAGNVYYYAEPYWSSDACFSLYPKQPQKLLDRFLFFCVKTKEGTLHSKIRSGAMPTIDALAVEKIRVPLPPIEIQKEIVKILDKFTEYDTELQSELQDRIKQYEYYRDKLLNFDEKSSGRVTYRKLGEICTISAGGDVPKNAFSKTSTKEYSVPIYSNGVGSNALYGYTNRAKICKPCVTIAARGTIGYSVLREEPFYPVVRLICLMPKKELNPGYLNYYLQTIKFDIPKTGIPQLTVPMVSRTVIPLPPLAVQNRIVDVLDNFDKICSDLKIGLPAEIKMHQKRYEYYRDKLLSFPEKK